MRLHNTLTRKTEEFTPLKNNTARVYSCGPTVYDHIHIGNLSSFIAADTLHRTLEASSYDVHHVMNFTDVDDKTIGRSRDRYPEDAPEEALRKLTSEYEEIFLSDMAAIGNDIEAYHFVPATAYVLAMQELIGKLYQGGFAYIADDGVYFSIEKYKESGKQYGQLLTLDSSNTSGARINNDEYDKDNVHDFALWKAHKEGEPAWELMLDGKRIPGRPGWHIECSAMSNHTLQAPFDIHTGGIDLLFPHHENEIAQSTAISDNPIYANFFVHNEHLLVDGKKMSKSLNNFFTLTDVIEKGFKPIAFRLLVLQSHYRNQSNFTWDNLQAAQNKLADYQAMADLRWQTKEKAKRFSSFGDAGKKVLEQMKDDMNTPQALAALSGVQNELAETIAIHPEQLQEFNTLLEMVDNLLGLQLTKSLDILDEQKHLLEERQAARDSSDWQKSDEIRDKLAEQGVQVRDTSLGQIWQRA